KVWWPGVEYGLPCGRRARSACARQVGQRPGLGWRLGHPGVEQTRMDAIVLTSGVVDVAGVAPACPCTVPHGEVIVGSAYVTPVCARPRCVVGPWGGLRV